MKRFTLIYSFLLAVALPLLIACTIDDVAGEDNPAQKGDNVTVRFRVSQAAPAMTRGTTWQDAYAEDKEMMYKWTVVAVEATATSENLDEKVVGIWTCELESEKEIDEIPEIVSEKFEKNKKYRFYSFANISDDNVNEFLGMGLTLDNDSKFEGEKQEQSGVRVCSFGEDTKVNYQNAKDKDVEINGNGFNLTSADNGFGAKGIPMSNIQEITIEKDSYDLIVVRMLAKIELQIYNDKGTNVEIESITLTDITKYVEETANLKLFPKYTDEKNANKMEAVHGDIQPNLNNDYKTEDVIITLNSEKGKVSAANSSDKTPVKITFYVNESATPDRNRLVQDPNRPTNRPTYKENFYHFFLEIKLTDETMARYALIDDNGTKDGEKWDYIARNDYRIIPIVLDDYKLDMIPYDFPAIGVYPASVKEEDGIYTINFHDYGHFHLVPQVTKYSSPATVVPYGEQSSTGDYWTLYGGSFETAWHTWADASKTTYTGDFYRTTVVGSADGDEAGGVPVWYKNDGSDGPKWSPNNNQYPPFIFGYINEHPNPGTNGSDRKVYHEFSINLYKGDTTPRQMTYRLYMILDAGQMLSSRGLGASAPRHTHHSH